MSTRTLLTSLTIFVAGVIAGGFAVGGLVYFSGIQRESSQSALVTQQPSKAIAYDDLFIQEANALQVVAKDGNFQVSDKKEEVERFTTYHPSENDIISFYENKDTSENSMMTLSGVRPDCPNRKIYADNYSTTILGIEDKANYSQKMNTHQYRLLCTDY